MNSLVWQIATTVKRIHFFLTLQAYAKFSNAPASVNTFLPFTTVMAGSSVSVTVRGDNASADLMSVIGAPWDDVSSYFLDDSVSEGAMVSLSLFNLLDACVGMF